MLSKYESIIRPIKPVRPGKSTKNRCRGCDGSTWGTWEDIKHTTKCKTHAWLTWSSILIPVLSFIWRMTQTQYLNWTLRNACIDSHLNTKCATLKCTHMSQCRPAGASRHHARPLTQACRSQELCIWKWWWWLLRSIIVDIMMSFDALAIVVGIGDGEKRIQSGFRSDFRQECRAAIVCFSRDSEQSLNWHNNATSQIHFKFPQKQTTIDLWWWCGWL